MGETSKNTFEEINNYDSDDTIVDTNLDKNSNIKNQILKIKISITKISIN